MKLSSVNPCVAATKRLAALVTVFSQAHLMAQTIVDIIPSANNVPILGVQYTIDGALVTQSSEATGVSVNRNGPVLLNSVTINDGGVIKTLNEFNDYGATVQNLNFTTSTGGVGVFDNGVITTTSNLANFQSKLEGITQDTDLLNYNFYDFVSNMPGAGVPDYDLLFARGFELDDFVLVSERWGNTFFTIQALGIEGDVIAGANLLRFGGFGGGGYEVYDWNSGYASDTYFTDQAFAFSVAKVSKFFEGTSVQPQDVYGFRIDNQGEADVKFFGLTDNTFVPEPSTALLALMGAGALLRRKR